MSKASSTTGDFANFLTGGLCDDSAASVHLTRRLSEKARAIFDKPYRALVDILRISERDAHYRLSGRRKYTAIEIARLLQSEQGIQFLVVLMDRQRPRWWKAVLRMGVLGSIEQRRQNDIKLMRRVFDADQTTTSNFSAALRVQDPDFYGPLLEGFEQSLSSDGGVDSAVGSELKRRRPPS